MLGGVSTSAGSPIVSGRFRPRSGALPGTDRCIATRPLRSQRQSTFCCSALRLGSSCWPSQLPLAEAHAPQAKGVHERYRHGEAPTVADAVIETKTLGSMCCAQRPTRPLRMAQDRRSPSDWEGEGG
jgi:hypothetical protein